MGINQLGYFGLQPSPRTLFVNSNGGQQQTVSLTGGPLPISLKSTQAVHVPQGNFLVMPGQYSSVQQWDSSAYLWRFMSPYSSTPIMVSSDGSNVQVVNTTGGVIGAIVTNRGTAIAASNNGFYGYNQALQFVAINNGQTTTGLTTATAAVAATTTGGALLNVFIGGSINTTVTITNGGTGFLEAPTLVVVPPSNQGSQPFIPATVTCTISGGVINGVTVVNQGAGYVSAPTIIAVNQEGDTVGGYANVVLTCTMTNIGQVSAVTVASPGTAQFTATPSITFTGTTVPGSAAATVIMNYSITAVALNAAGGAYGATQPTITIAAPSVLLAATTNTNPAIETNLVPQINQPIIQAFSAAGGTMTYATWTVTAGGNPDVVYLYPI